MTGGRYMPVNSRATPVDQQTEAGVDCVHPVSPDHPVAASNAVAVWPDAPPSADLAAALAAVEAYARKAHTVDHQTLLAESSAIAAYLADPWPPGAGPPPLCYYQLSSSPDGTGTERVTSSDPC
jgi:hypothetical protein